MIIDLKSFAYGALLGSFLTGMGMLSVIFYYKYPSFKTVSIELATLVAKQTRTQCEQIKSKNFTLRADGLAIKGNCK